MGRNGLGEDQVPNRPRCAREDMEGSEVLAVSRAWGAILVGTFMRWAQVHC